MTGKQSQSSQLHLSQVGLSETRHQHRVEQGWVEAEVRLGCGLPKHGPVCGLLAVEMGHQSVRIGLRAQALAACTRQLCAAGSVLEGQMVDALPPLEPRIEFHSG